jgi:hypothetical protein
MMNDNLKERKRVSWTKARRPTATKSLVIPCLVILIVMLTIIGAMQHKVISEYQEAVVLLDESSEYQMVLIDDLRAENESLRDNVSFSEQTLNVVDLDYIQEIPEGVDLRIRLVLQALGGE